MSEASEIARLIVDSAPDAIIFGDREGLIREWNGGATRIFGHTREEAVGQSLDLIVPERFREAHWRGYDAALAAGHTKSDGKPLPTRSVHKDGTPIYVELSFGVLSDAGGTVLGAIALARDITERFTNEREERARVRALEERLAALEGGATPA